MRRSLLTLAQSLVRSCRDWPTGLKVRTCFVLNRNTTMAHVKTLVDSKIADKKVIIFSKSYCPFCTKAKHVFLRLIEEGKLSSDDYEVMEIENNPDCDAIQNYLQTVTGARSVSTVCHIHLVIVVGSGF